MGQKYARDREDQIELLKAAVIAQARAEWQEAVGRDWDEKLARIVAGRKPARGEERARAVALDLANALSAYERLRFPSRKTYGKRARTRPRGGKWYRKRSPKDRAARRRKHLRLKRRLSGAAISVLQAIERHFEPVLLATEEYDGDELPLSQFLRSIGTPTPAMAPRVRVAAMPTEVWSAFGLSEAPGTRLLAIASLLLGNFPDLPAEKTRFSVADVIQLEANGIRSSLRNVKSNPERARLVASRVSEEVTRIRERLARLEAVRVTLQDRNSRPPTAD